MPSEYPVLDNRPIDQWKVTELKEELKRRKLATKGLKGELIKRLDEAIRSEREAPTEDADDGVKDVDEAEENVVGESEGGVPVDNEETGDGNNGNVSEVDTDLAQVGGNDSVTTAQQVDNEAPEQKEEPGIVVGDEPTGAEMSSGTADVDVGDQVCEIATGGSGLHDEKPERNNEEPEAPREDVKLDASDPDNQVLEVKTNLGSPLNSNSVSADSVSFCEKNKIEDNIIADNVKIEPDVKPEMVQPSSTNLVPDGGKSHLEDVEEPLENEPSLGQTQNNLTNADMSQKSVNANLASSEKLSLDRSSGDDSMDEDGLESKQVDSTYKDGEPGVKAEKSEVNALKEEVPPTAMDSDFPAEEKTIHSEDKGVVAGSSDKRKLPDQESILNNEPSKRQRRWKSEGSNTREHQTSDVVAAKDVPPSPAPRRNFSRSDSGGALDTPKEREVPPSTKAATTSLRIDNFLRPFTLKAVQQLLANTGTVASFWMDHIKTHCYVTYSSVEEAVATRNAVYNLQWPPNGGRHLVAEFVDPQEVKVRVDPPPPPPAAPVSDAPAMAPEPSPKQPQPSPRQQNLRQQLSRHNAVPPPPPLSNQVPVRERVHPPPPPPEEKLEAPILTLDDLFKKTKTTPRIYYLPLSEEQVSAKLEARKKNPRVQ